MKILTELENYEDLLYTQGQLALRDYVGMHTIDEILENKNEMSGFILNYLKSKEAELYIKIESAGVKDIILPGEIRKILNTVLIATKQAQANVITRREEVASTRSLLNTAKLMDENKTLYKLKQLEYLERICQNVGNINIGGQETMLKSLDKIIYTGDDEHI